MKNSILFIIFFHLLLFDVFSQKVFDEFALAGPSGAYIYLGTDIPNGTRTKFYQIERRSKKSEWKVIATTHIPANSKSLYEQVSLYQKLLPGSEKLVFNTDSLFRIISSVESIEAAGPGAYGLAVRLAIGNVFYDNQVEEHVWYQYRISRVSPIGKGQMFISNEVKINQQKSFDPIQLAQLDRRKGSLYIKWSSVGLNGPRFGMIYKLNNDGDARYLDQAILYTLGDTTYYVYYVDEYDLEREAQYYITPLDQYGNHGAPSEVALVRSKTISENYFHNLQAKPIKGIDAIELNWSLNDLTSITSINILRSENFDGPFDLYATVDSEIQKFLDIDIQADKIYYYQLIANHEHSPENIRSTRFFEYGIDEIQPLPPSINDVSMNNNKLNLSIKCADPATYGIRIYQLSEMDSDTTLLSDLIPLSGDSANVEINLEELVAGLTYQLFARGENYSGLESPYSIPFQHTQPSESTLPPITGLEAWLDGTEILVYWDDLVSNYSQVAGYEVSVSNNNGVTWNLLTSSDSLWLKNSFTHKLAETGVELLFGIAPVGYFEKHEGSKSLVAINTPALSIPPPAGLTAFINEQNMIELNWNSSTDPNVSAYSVYKKTIGSPAKNLATIENDKSAWQGKNPKPGLYFFSIVAIDRSGNESQPSDEVAVRVK